MIRKSGYRFSEKIMLKSRKDHAQIKEIERDDDSKKRHHALARQASFRLCLQLEKASSRCTFAFHDRRPLFGSTRQAFSRATFMFAVVRSSSSVMTPSNSLKKRQKVSTDRLEREPKETYLQQPLFAQHVCHDPWRLLFALAFAAIGALFAYLLVHDFWTGQSQRAVLVATIYFG